MAQMITPSQIFQNLRELSAVADEEIKEISNSEKLEDEWLELIKAAALKIVNDDGKSLNGESKQKKLEVPSIISFVQPDNNKPKKSLLFEFGREHIHRAKKSKVAKKSSNSKIIADRTATVTSLNSKDSGFPRSSLETFSSSGVFPNSEDATSSNANDATIRNSKDETVSISEGVTVLDSERLTVSNAQDVTHSKSKSTTLSNNKIYTIKESIEEHSESIIEDKIENGTQAESSSCVQQLAPVTISKSCKSLRNTPEVASTLLEQTYVNSHHTPNVSENPTMGYFTQVLDKKFKAVCSKASNYNESKTNSSNSVHPTPHSEKEILKNVPSKNVTVTNSAVETPKDIANDLNQEENPGSSHLSSKQKAGNILKTVFGKKPAVKKEKEKLKELKIKEEKASENLQKVLTLRQMKLQENKRKREEKLELAAEKRQKMEKEKEMKKTCKHDVISAPKSTENKSSKKILVDNSSKSKEHKTKAKKNMPKTDATMPIETPALNTTSVLKSQNPENMKLVESQLKSKENKSKAKKNASKADASVAIEASAHNATFLLKSQNPQNMSHESKISPQFAIPAASKEVKTPLKSIMSKANEANIQRTPDVLSKKAPIQRTPDVLSKKEVSSYEMTPLRDDGGSDDSADEREYRKNKKIPDWAMGTYFKSALLNQQHHPKNVDEIFGTVIDPPNLTIIFGIQKKYYSTRSSSAIWHVPPALDDE